MKIIPRASTPLTRRARRNYGFNELANEWHSDHVFKHDPDAIECFLLVAFLAYNIFHVFLARNVKPSARQGKTQIFWARLIAAELYRGAPRRHVALRFSRTISSELCLVPGIRIAVFLSVNSSKCPCGPVIPPLKAIRIALTIRLLARNASTLL
jgi:hypothetical protein